ncbi:MAG: hypothetical protein NUK63_06310 [Candidatus Bathyarchaeum tardum]|nr:MAG: hypothetical protein NUK63_06310 [Candidatus Bathyarchaeum tardum]
MKFFEALPEVFRERYLNTHEKFLGSIADVMVYLYLEKRNDWSGTCNNMLHDLIPAGKLQKRKDVETETIHFRNLRNCWYHECALHNPLDNIDERMRFAAWNVIQCYYAVFSSITSIVRLFDVDVKGHDGILKYYLSNVICSRRFRNFVLPPFSFYLSQNGSFSRTFSKRVDWEYADEYHLPNIKSCLEYAKERMRAARGDNYCKRRIGISNYLRTLREWINYQDAYLFFRLYGNSVKENLDRYLKQITFAYCVQTEFFLLRTFGLEAMELQYETFSNELQDNLDINSPALDERFEVYSDNYKLF